MVNHTGSQVMRDLTVTDIHTYYVVAGENPVLVHNITAVACKRLDDRPISDGNYRQMGYHYQEYVTGQDYEQAFQYMGRRVDVDGGPDPHGFIVEAKFTGFSESDWARSQYNPAHPHYKGDAGIVKQMEKWLSLDDHLQGKGVRYAVSTAGGAAHFRSLANQYFPDAVASGQLAVFQVPIGEGITRPGR